MMRSMFSGVSGLRAHQTRMDVIGNNIANVNTVAFKSSRVTFQEIFNQTIRGASAPDPVTGRGGSNPMQVGLGISVGSVDTITTRGSVQRTDNPTDLSIEGDGFFIVRGGDNDTYRFTRAGNFGIDKNGNLVTASGMNVYGWQAYETDLSGNIVYDTERSIEKINLYEDAFSGNKRLIDARATTQVGLAGNLNAVQTFPTTAGTPATPSEPTYSSTSKFTVPITVYDSLGNDYRLQIDFVRNNVDNSGTIAGQSYPLTMWYYRVLPAKSSEADVESISCSNSTAFATGEGVADGYIAFDANGNLVPESVDASMANFVNVQSITITPQTTEIGAGSFDVNIDFTKISMYKADGSIRPTIDGYPTGSLVTFSIGSDGIITGVYSNGQQSPLGMLALANFENAAGLQKVGENMYLPTTNSGEFKKGVKAGTEGIGTISPGTLEMSNVDLSKEFTEMIITQRGFQANSRIITASDEILQELVNLKR